MSARSMVCLLGLVVSVGMFAEDAPVQGAENQNAEQLVKNLGSDDFNARNEAEKALAKMGSEVLPLLKQTVASTADMEVKARAERALKAVSLAHETDPEALAVYAKADAQAKRYADAAKFYARSVKFYNEQAQKASGQEQADLQAKAKKAAEREKRAAALATNEEMTKNARVTVRGGGGGMAVVAVRAGVDPNVDEGSDDW